MNDWIIPLAIFAAIIVAVVYTVWSEKKGIKHKWI